MQEQSRLVALVSAIGLEPSDAESLARQAAPLVVAKLPLVAARAAEQALAASGVLTMLTPHAALANHALPLRAKRLVAGGDGYLVELWRGPAALLDVSKIRLIVRAKLVRVRTAPPEPGRVRWLSEPPADAESIIHGEELGQSIPDRPARVTMRDVIELHVRDGTRIRIDGSKFNFDVLGSGRIRRTRIGSRCGWPSRRRGPLSIRDSPCFDRQPGLVVHCRFAAAWTTSDFRTTTRFLSSIRCGCPRCVSSCCVQPVGRAKLARHNSKAGLPRPLPRTLWRCVPECGRVWG